MICDGPSDWLDRLSEWDEADGGLDSRAGRGLRPWGDGQSKRAEGGEGRREWGSRGGKLSIVGQVGAVGSVGQDRVRERRALDSRRGKSWNRKWKA